jgi:hypothetical protein
LRADGLQVLGRRINQVIRIVDPARKVSFFAWGAILFVLPGRGAAGAANVLAGRFRPEVASQLAAENSRPDFISSPFKASSGFSAALLSQRLAGGGTISPLSKLGRWRLCGEHHGAKKVAEKRT